MSAGRAGQSALVGVVTRSAGRRAVQLNRETTIGEIGLNAVYPDWAGAGIGTAMHEVVDRPNLSRSADRCRITGRSPAASFRAWSTVGHGFADKRRHALNQFLVWLCAECVVDGRERQPKRNEAVASKISRSLKPTSRKCSTSVCVDAFESSTTWRDHRARAASLLDRPLGSPWSTFAAVASLESSASRAPHAREQ